MPPLYLHSVKPQKLCKTSGAGKGCTDIGYTLPTHLFAGFLQRQRIDSRRPDRIRLRMRNIPCHRTPHPHMTKLRNYFAAGCMHCPAYPLPRTQGSATVKLRHTTVIRGRLIIYRSRFSNNQSHFSLRTAAIVSSHLRRGNTVRRQLSIHRSHDDARYQRQFSVRKRTKQGFNLTNTKSS